MDYRISLTTLQRHLLAGIPGDGITVEAPRSNELQDWRYALMPVLRALVRCAFDRNAHVLVAHPFSPVASLFLFFARSATFYDDGIAYYANTPLPRGRRARVYRWLSRRHVDWLALAANGGQRYQAMLRSARIREAYLIFPDLIDLAVPCHKIELESRLQGLRLEKGADARPAVLFLDAPSFIHAGVDDDRLFDHFEKIARAGSFRLFFKSHPRERSSLSQRLAEVAWAHEVHGDLEEALGGIRPAEIYSFYSSGALTAFLADPGVRIFNIATPVIDRESRASLGVLFDRIGATNAAL